MPALSASASATSWRGAGRFVAEGTVVLSMLASPLAAANGFAARSLLILENRLAGFPTSWPDSARTFPSMSSAKA